MKIIVTIIPTNLVANSLLSFFWCFHRNQEQETNFLQVGGLVCVFLFLRPSTVKASSVWISWDTSWDTREQINNLMLNKLTSYANFLHRYFRIHHLTFLTSQVVLFAH